MEDLCASLTADALIIPTSLFLSIGAKNNSQSSQVGTGRTPQFYDGALPSIMLSDRSQMLVIGTRTLSCLFHFSAAYFRKHMCPTGANNLKCFASVTPL